MTAVMQMTAAHLFPYQAKIWNPAFGIYRHQARLYTLPLELTFCRVIVGPNNRLALTSEQLLGLKDRFPAGTGLAFFLWCYWHIISLLYLIQRPYIKLPDNDPIYARIRDSITYAQYLVFGVFIGTNLLFFSLWITQPSSDPTHFNHHGRLRLSIYFLRGLYD